jgi:N-acetylglucosaminyl-diphospho-decaprenol L-rhamnosyltransferase
MEILRGRDDNYPVQLDTRHNVPAPEPLHRLPMSRCLVVIVNYKTPDLTVDCVRSLVEEREAIPDLKVVVVDNASGDGSLQILHEAARDPDLEGFMQVLAAPRNGGFAYGNNEGIRAALASDDPPQTVLLLNSDTYIRKGAISTLLDFLETNPAAGIACSRLEDPDGTWQQSRFRFPTLLGEIESGFCFGPVTRLLRHHVVPLPPGTERIEVDWAAGASMAIRREVFTKIGLMDEAYFLYYEETDFCLRAKRAGFQVWYVPESRVVHLVGRSTGVTIREHRPARRPRYWFQSRWRYFKTGHGTVYAFLASLGFLVGRMTYRLRCLMTGQKIMDPPRFLSDFVRYGFRG